MEEYKNYVDLITAALNSDVKKVDFVSETNNIVFKVQTETQGIVYAKFYLNRSSHIDHEMDLYDIMDRKYLKDVVTSFESPKFAIFKELKGKALDELSAEEIEQNKEKIVDSLIYFYETVGNKKTEGFGLLDDKMHGTSQSFQEFITNRQMDTEKVLEKYPVLNSAFSKIYAKYKDLLVGDNSLVPIDTNAKNVMLTDDGNVKFIDPGELISAPKLMGYGDFVAHTYKTPLYDTLIKKLDLSKEDEQRLRIYAVFSSLNVLAFLEKLGVPDLDKVIPYGNTNTFYSMIEEHLHELGIETQELDAEER